MDQWFEIKTMIEYLGSDPEVNLNLKFENPVNDKNLFLAKLCVIENPKHIFEIGTWHGGMDTICAANSNALITTTTLAKEYVDTYKSNDGKHKTGVPSMSEIGKYVRDHGYQSRIRQLYWNSKEIDMNFLFQKGEVDIAIIDGGHDIEHVIIDTNLVWEYVKEGGYILWDDFDPASKQEFHKEVVEGARQVCEKKKITPVYISDTRWLVYRKN